MYELLIKSHFDAAHKLRGYVGKCANIHGHSWLVEVIVSGTELDKTGMLVDFSVLKKVLKDLLEKLDHKYLNEIEPFREELNPTAENISALIYKTYKKHPDILKTLAKVKEVRVWESPNACAIYKENN